LLILKNPVRGSASDLLFGLSKNLCGETRRENLRLIRTRERDGGGAVRTENRDKSPLSCRSVVRLPAVTSPLFTPIPCSFLPYSRAASSSFILPLRSLLYEEKSFFASAKNVNTEFPVLLVSHETKQPLFQIEDTSFTIFREKRKKRDCKIFTILNLKLILQSVKLLCT